MVSFPQPKFEYNFNLDAEIEALHAHRARESRFIPEKSEEELLLASWNIANLGVHRRKPAHYRLIAEIISWFDVVAIQEVADNLEGLRSIHAALPGNHFKILYNDRGGNDERACFIYDSRKVSLQNKIGEVAVPPKEKRFIRLPGVAQDFQGFDRNPFFATFAFGDFIFLLANLHIYYGSDKSKDVGRRALETFAVGRWADLRRDDKHRVTENIIALGDFNLPKVEPGDPIYEALTRRGFTVPDHSTKIFSNITDDKQYDQFAFFPGLKRRIANQGVFDYDSALFAKLFNGDGSLPRRSQNARFRSYCRYYISDHRPIWMQLQVAA